MSQTAAPRPPGARVAPSTRTTSRRNPLDGLVATIGGNNLSLIAALVILVTIITTQTKYFFLPTNLLNIGLAITLLGLLAIGQTVVIISGGLDISVGSMTGLCSVAAAMAIVATNNPALGVVAGLLAGAVAGMGNALIIILGRVNPVIATLATYSAYQGVALLITNGSAVGVSNQAFNSIGSGHILEIPVPLLILVGVAAAFFIFLRFTDVGRNIYAMGGNPVAARLSGINVNMYKFGIYTLSGLVAGLTGIILTARTTSGQPVSGSVGLELQAITAAVLGGCALAGGKGTIGGTILGVMILGVLNNGMILMNVPTFYQLLARGAVLVLAVVIQEWRTRRAARAR
jgi:L-arabinose transport system permease protein